MSLILSVLEGPPKHDATECCSNEDAEQAQNQRNAGAIRDKK